jgi:hypothetical protein
MTDHTANIVELSGLEIDEVNGGAFWIPLAGLVALAGLAILAYQTGQKDGQCHSS